MLPFMAPTMMGQVAALATTTWSPSDRSPDWTLSEGNLRATRPNPGSEATGVRSTTYRAAGKYYFEQTMVAVGPITLFAMANSSYDVKSGVYPGNDAGKSAIRYNSNGTIVFGGSVQTSGLAAVSAAGVLGIALDRDAGTLEWIVNGASQFKATQIPSGPLSIVLGNDAAAGASIRLNCGQVPFSYPIPSGFSPWG